MKIVYALLIVLVFLAAAWYLYFNYFTDPELEVKQEEEFEMVPEQPEDHLPAEYRGDYYQVLDQAWHNPEERDTLVQLSALGPEIEDSDVRQHLAIAVALGARLQGERGLYRQVTALLAARHPDGPAGEMLSFEDQADDCHSCQGSGLEPAACQECGGSGECSNRLCDGGSITYRDAGGSQFTRDCPVCEGAGQCPDCEGDGAIQRRCRQCGGSGRGSVEPAAIKDRYRQAIELTINLLGSKYDAFNGQYRYENGALIRRN